MRTAWIAGGCIASGFALGLVCAPWISRSSPGSDTANPYEAKRSVDSARHKSDSGTGKAPSRDTAATGIEQIEIPADAAIAMAKQQLRSVSLFKLTFKHEREIVEPQEIEPLFQLVGASTGEQAAVMDILGRFAARLKEREATGVKLRQADAKEIVLDISGMKGVLAEGARQARQELGELMPGPRGRVMQESIPLDKAYGGMDLSDDGEYSKPAFQKFRDNIRLKIVRSKSGNLLMAGLSCGGRFISTSVKFPDDGTPIPADQAFGPRWQPLLSGLTLLPADLP